MMNNRIRELAVQAGLISSESYEFDQSDLSTAQKKFAELIVENCIMQCRREWYDLNNAEQKENETARDIGLRVGRKNGVLKIISRINQHFGIEND